MKIVLMRHGKPVLNLEAMRRLRKSAKEVGQIVEEYKSVDLSADELPPVDSMKIAQACNTIFRSDLPRAISSSQKLELNQKIITNSCFAEPDMPYLNWQSPKLKVYTWCVIFWVLWFFGFSKNGEAKKSVNLRAEQSVQMLTAAAGQDGDAFLLGHGIMNRLIAGRLEKLGWVIVTNSKNSYWSYIVFEKN